jgi:AcrR family transcriptional regulator
MKRSPKAAKKVASRRSGPKAERRPPAARDRRTQRERADSSKKGLLGAALELIAERGYRGASLAAIGERAGYSRGLVTERFGSKEGLLRELVSRLMTRWRSLVVDDVVGAQSGARALSAVVHAHRRAIADGPETMRALYVLLFESILDLPEVRAEFRAMDARLRQLAEAYLVRGQAEGTVRKDVDAGAQAALALATVRGITLQWMIDPDALDLDRVYAELGRWLERGLGPRGPAKGAVSPRRPAKKKRKTATEA